MYQINYVIMIVVSITKFVCERYLATVVIMHMMLKKRGRKKKKEEEEKKERGSIQMEISSDID